MRVLLTDQAEADLEEIADWIARDSPLRAISYVRELRASCHGLSNDPERFQLVDRSRSRQVRRRVHGAHLIFYRIAQDQVVVLRILHGAREYEPLLFPKDEP